MTFLLEKLSTSKKNNEGLPDVTEEKEKLAKQSDTTVIPDLESEESAAEIENQ